MELVRQKNVATYITFPIIDADGDTVSSAADLDSEIDTWTDGAAPDGFADCTNEATEVGTTGIYYLSITQTEMNNDYIYIQVKTSTSGAKTQHILINTMVGDPLNRATTDDGGTINVTGGAIDTVTTVTNQVTANVTAISGDATAADNSEAFFDGTGYAGTNNVIPVVTTVNGLAANTVTASALAADAVDEIWDEALTEPTATFAWAGSMRNLINWVGALSRNKITQTSTTQTLRNDADAGDISTSTVSDDGTTFTRGEWT